MVKKTFPAMSSNVIPLLLLQYEVLGLYELISIDQKSLC